MSCGHSTEVEVRTLSASFVAFGVGLMAEWRITATYRKYETPYGIKPHTFAFNISNHRICCMFD